MNKLPIMSTMELLETAKEAVGIGRRAVERAEALTIRYAQSPSSRLYAEIKDAQDTARRACQLVTECQEAAREQGLLEEHRRVHESVAAAILPKVEGRVKTVEYDQEGKITRIVDLPAHILVTPSEQVATQ